MLCYSGIQKIRLHVEQRSVLVGNGDSPYSTPKRLWLKPFAFSGAFRLLYLIIILQANAFGDLGAWV